VSILISGTPRSNRITNMPASKFNLSVITHGEMRSSQESKREGVRDDRMHFEQRRSKRSYVSQMLLL
jgi:hypothetical protein